MAVTPIGGMNNVINAYQEYANRPMEPDRSGYIKPGAKGLLYQCRQVLITDHYSKVWNNIMNSPVTVRAGRVQTLAGGLFETPEDIANDILDEVYAEEIAKNVLYEVGKETGCDLLEAGPKEWSDSSASPGYNVVSIEEATVKV